MTEDVASLFPSRWLHPLAPLKRLSPVNLLAANGFDKPFAASKFELCVENNPPYDCNHAEDSLFYEHRSIAGGFHLLPSAAEEEGDGEIERQIQRNRRAGGAAEVIRRNKPEHGACKRAEHGKQVVLAQIPREVPGRRGGQDKKGIDDHQAHPAHGERDDDGNADREERLRFLRRSRRWFRRSLRERYSRSL